MRDCLWLTTARCECVGRYEDEFGSLEVQDRILFKSRSTPSTFALFLLCLSSTRYLRTKPCSCLYFRLDADESWSVSANEWGLFTRYFDAPDCVKTMVQWAEEKCAAAGNVEILDHKDTDSVKDLLKEVFRELDPLTKKTIDTLDEAAVAPAKDSTDTPQKGQRKAVLVEIEEVADTPQKVQRKTRDDEIEEVAEFLRMHLFVKVSHLRGLTEEDWDKLSRQKIPYRVVKMLQSKVCQIAKCLKCIDYNVIISTSEIQKFCKSKEDMLPKAGLPASQSDQTFQTTASKDALLPSSASAKDQKVKVIRVGKQGKGNEITNMDLTSKAQLKQGDRITIGARPHH